MPIALRDAVEWNSWLWAPAVQWVLGDPSHFRAKRVLDLGCYRGKMSYYFAPLGAVVEGWDVDARAVEIARAESNDNVAFRLYDGDLSRLPTSQFDYVFTKSVLVLLGDINGALRQIARTLKPAGEYLAVENLEGGRLLEAARRFIHRNWLPYWDFRPLDSHALTIFRKYFRDVSYRTYWGIVVSICASKRSPAPLTIGGPHDGAW